MKSRVLRLLLTVCVPAALAAGQYAVSTILLPDSLGGATGPQSLAWNPGRATLYAGSLSGCVTAIDATACHKTARIPFAASVRRICYDPVFDRLYCGHAAPGGVSVVD